MRVSSSSNMSEKVPRVEVMTLTPCFCSHSSNRSLKQKAASLGACPGGQQGG